MSSFVHFESKDLLLGTILEHAQKLLIGNFLFLQYSPLLFSFQHVRNQKQLFEVIVFDLNVSSIENIWLVISTETFFCISKKFLMGKTEKNVIIFHSNQIDSKLLAYDLV